MNDKNIVIILNNISFTFLNPLYILLYYAVLTSYYMVFG
jgi:hypothetical protein